MKRSNIKYNLHENENGIDFSLHIKPNDYEDGVLVLNLIRKVLSDLKG